MNDKSKTSNEMELQKLEQRFSQLLGQQRPRFTYVKTLKEELKNSRIFELRRSVGAILVASLGILFAGALSFSIAVLAQKARRRMNA